LGVLSTTAEEINTLFVKAVSANDSAIDMDWELNIQGAHLHRKDVYCLTQLKVIVAFVDCISKSHRRKGCCNAEDKTKGYMPFTIEKKAVMCLYIEG
jgi:hypothetical protein